MGEDDSRMTEQRQCLNCKHRASNPQKLDGGFCRRYPPKVFMMATAPGELQVMGHWPPVGNDSWCGEFGATEECRALALAKRNGDVGCER